MLGPVPLALLAFDFQQQHHSVGQAHDEIGKIGVGDAEILVGDRQFQMVVAGVTGDQIAGLLQPERRRLLPGIGVGDHLVDVAANRRHARPGGLEIHFGGRADGLVSVQPRQ
mgnify:CR=1 FL=1